MVTCIRAISEMNFSLNLFDWNKFIYACWKCRFLNDFNFFIRFRKNGLKDLIKSPNSLKSQTQCLWLTCTIYYTACRWFFRIVVVSCRDNGGFYYQLFHWLLLECIELIASYTKISFLTLIWVLKLFTLILNSLKLRLSIELICPHQRLPAACTLKKKMENHH